LLLKCTPVETCCQKVVIRIPSKSSNNQKCSIENAKNELQAQLIDVLGGRQRAQSFVNVFTGSVSTQLGWSGKFCMHLEANIQDTVSQKLWTSVQIVFSLLRLLQITQATPF